MVNPFCDHYHHHHHHHQVNTYRGGSRGRVQGVRTPPLPWDDLRFSNTTGILQKKKKKMWFIGVEVEQETSAPPPKKNPGSAPDLISLFMNLNWSTTLCRLPHLFPGEEADLPLALSPGELCSSKTQTNKQNSIILFPYRSCIPVLYNSHSCVMDHGMSWLFKVLWKENKIVSLL